MAVTDDTLAPSAPSARTAERPPVTGRRGPGHGLFRAFWRWHFYASLLVIPILLLLTVTGLVYLFRFQLEPALHADVMTVHAPAAQDRITQPYSAQLKAVRRAYPGAVVTSMTEPSGRDRSTTFSVVTAAGTRDVYVNPWNGRVLGSLDPNTTLSGRAVRLHGDLMVGRYGDYVIEVGACWAIVMALTGYYLFVRGRAARLRRKAAGARAAALRHRHGLVGAALGAGLLGLLVTGLPWTGFWGEKVQHLATSHGSSMWSNDPGALSDPTSTLDESLPHSHAVPWALGDTAVPRSRPGPGRSVANLDTAVAVAGRQGLAHPMTVALPGDESGVFSVIGYAFHDPGRERTVHVDQFGGAVVATYGYRDYPLLAKVVSQGIALHEGRRLGVFNFWATTAFCLGVLFMCVTGPLMWWKRRPRRSDTTRSLAAPRGRLPLRASPLLAAIVAALALVLPLFGLTLVAALVLDQVLLRRVGRLRAWFNVAS
jgi:uncharacterized iron-regulated membrane protein